MGNGTTFTWYGHACVELNTPGGKVVLFDPWFGNPTSPRTADSVDRCEVMLVSHGHHDHLGAFPMQIDQADALTIARRTRPAWPCIHEMSLWLEEVGAGETEVIGFNKGGTVDVDEVRSARSDVGPQGPARLQVVAGHRDGAFRGSARTKLATVNSSQIMTPATPTPREKPSWPTAWPKTSPATA